MKSVNKYTKWLTQSYDNTGWFLVDHLWGAEPQECRKMKNPHVFVETGYVEDDFDTGERTEYYIPLLSEKWGWKRNISAIKEALDNDAIGANFFEYEPHLWLLKKCLGKHYKNFVRELQATRGFEIKSINFTPKGGRKRPPSNRIKKIECCGDKVIVFVDM